MLKYSFFSLLAFFCISQALSQWDKDTVFYDENWTQCNPALAKYYRLIDVDTNNILFLVEDFYISGKIQMKGSFRSINPDDKRGKFNYWYENGQIWIECEYLNGKLNGLYNEWYPNGKKKTELTYIKGKINGTEKIWDEDGVISKTIEYKEGNKDGYFITYYTNGRPVRKDLYKNDQFKKGKCYTYEGKDTSYFNYFIMPGFIGGVEGFKKYISEKLIFPDTAKTNNEEGLVKVKFTIDKDGNIGNIDLVEEDKEYFNKEAIRVVKEMPKWLPGKRDGKAINVTLTVPIYFRLK